MNRNNKVNSQAYNPTVETQDISNAMIVNSFFMNSRTSSGEVGFGVVPGKNVKLCPR